MSKQILEIMHDDIKEIRSDLKAIIPKVHQNTDDLADHIEGVQQNRSRIKHIEDKLTVGYLLKLVGAGIVGVGALAGAFWSIVKVYSFFTGAL